MSRAQSVRARKGRWSQIAQKRVGDPAAHWAFDGDASHDENAFFWALARQAVARAAKIDAAATRSTASAPSKLSFDNFAKLEAGALATALAIGFACATTFRKVLSLWLSFTTRLRRNARGFDVPESENLGMLTLTAAQGFDKIRAGRELRPTAALTEAHCIPVIYSAPGGNPRGSGQLVRWSAWEGSSRPVPRVGVGAPALRPPPRPAADPHQPAGAVSGGAEACAA